jgi:hypothetical protein
VSAHEGAAVWGGEVAELAAGQRWAHPKPGPWGGHGVVVTITDVRDGWVRYDYESTPDERSPEKFFREWYSVRVAS